LLRPFTRKADINSYEDITAFLLEKKNKEENPDLYENMKCTLENIEYYSRIVNEQSAWEGVTWILQLLPDRPLTAIQSLQLYFEAECMSMPDDRIIGIEQCINIIEARYINVGDRLEKKLYNLSPRDFEYLVAILYDRMGYKVTLTPATRDGGKDVIAEICDYERREKVFIECKRYRTTEMSIEKVRAFAYTVHMNNANRGVIFTTGRVRNTVREVDSHITVFDIEETILLLNSQFGSRWYEDFANLKKNFENKKNY